jgi:hypothetical protein
METLPGQVTNECCGVGGCRTSLPPVCSEQCAASWMPFSKQCSVWLGLPGTVEHLEVVSTNCEHEEYGRYHRGSTRGRCADNDLQVYQSQVQAACCRPEHGRGSGLCPGVANGQSGWDLFPPVDPTTHQPVCTTHCREFFEEVYSECHPRFNDDLATQGATLRQFLCLCQGLDSRTCSTLPAPGSGGGGSHRRSLVVTEEEGEPEQTDLEGWKDEARTGFLAAMVATKAPAKEAPAKEALAELKLTWEEMQV